MSFLSVEPQSRVVLENYSNTLLAQFDSHFGIIEDRYLAFFQERSLDPVRVLRVTLTFNLQANHRGNIVSCFQISPTCLASFLSSKYRVFTEPPSEGKNRRYVIRPSC